MMWGGDSDRAEGQCVLPLLLLIRAIDERLIGWMKISPARWVEHVLYRFDATLVPCHDGLARDGSRDGMNEKWC